MYAATRFPITGYDSFFYGLIQVGGSTFMSVDLSKSVWLYFVLKVVFSLATRLCCSLMPALEEDFFGILDNLLA